MLRHSLAPIRRTILLSVSVGLAIAACATMASAQTLRGRAADPDARPVAGADVIVLVDQAVVTTLKTQSDGRFGPVTLPAGAYDVTVSAPGLRSAPSHVTLAAGAATDLNVTLALSAVRESIVVSASQTDTTQSRVTDAVTVINRGDLQLRQTETVADALRAVPGFGVVSSGGRGALTSIFPRGGESDYTLVLVDGIPQNTFGGGFDAAHLSTAEIERIEVVRGPASALYGSGAIGGVVQVLTRAGGPLRGDFSIEGGGYGFMRTAASAGGSQGAWQWSGALDRLTTDGDTRFVPSLNRDVANDQYERTAGSGSVNWSDRPTRSIRVDVRGDSDDKGFPGPYGSDPLNRYSGIDEISNGHNTLKEVGASASFGSPAAGRHHGQFTFADLNGRFESPFGPSSDRTRRETGRYQYDIDVHHVGISSGTEFLHERVDNGFITGEAGAPVPVSRNVWGLFTEARPSIGGRGYLTLGARLERISRTALEGDGFARPTFENDVVWSFNPKASIAWFLRAPDSSGWTKVRAGAGTGIKPPTGFDIAFTDNPNLKPERNRSFDAGIEQSIVGSTVVVDATVFFDRYDDLIVAVGTDTVASRYKTDNIANARARGLETGIDWRLGGGISGRAAWTWLDTEVLGLDQAPNTAPAPFHVGDPLLRRPRNQGFVDVAWSSARASAFFHAGGRGKMADLEPNFGSPEIDSPGYATVSLGATFKILRHLEAFGRVMNAFDRQYEETLGFPALGRSASVGIRVAASR